MLETHVIRLGTHAEKDYLIKAYAWFDEVMLNANLVEGAAASLALFLKEMLDKGKGYFIDPVTYAFALSPSLLMRNQNQAPSREYIKRTFNGLARAYGQVVNNSAGKRSLQPGDFSTPELKEEFCRCVLSYQRSKFSEAAEESLDFLETPLPALEPVRIVAPYFHISGDMDWLDLNIDFAKMSCQIEPQTWTMVCLDSLLLDSDATLCTIVDYYKNVPTSGYLIWATDFREERATRGQIAGIRHLVQGLSQDGKKPVINVFGGYFSCLLARDGLTGLSHGLGYGERRNIEPVLGGGLPPAKYYLPAIHQNIRLAQLASISHGLDKESFLQDVCDCIICRGLVEQGQGVPSLMDQYTDSEMRLSNGRYRQVATPLVYRLTRFHYLANKHSEFQKCIQCDSADLLSQLNDAYDRFREHLGTSSLMYLRNWREALS